MSNWAYSLGLVFSNPLSSKRLLRVEPTSAFSNCCSINRGKMKMFASASMGWDVRHTYLGLSLVVVLAMGTSGAHAPHGLVPSDRGITLRQPCGLRTCDLRTHYCDDVIGDCARCDDDCHPARIGGDAKATEDCQRICQWYYLTQKLEYREKASPQTLFPSDAALNDDDYDDRKIGQMSRAELRIFIEMELLKSKTPSCLENAFVIFICFCGVLLVARCWLHAFANQGHLKPRFIVEENLQ